MMVPLSRILFLAVTLASAQASSPWLYQLQGGDPKAIARSGFHHVIMDYSSDGSASGEYSRAQIASLKTADVTPIAYFSIGEAEDYRFYWKPEWAKKPPAWLGRENPDWKGNYEVRYWNTDWRDNVLRPYLSRIVAAGFAGVYLDIVDGFEYWGDPDTYRKGREVRQPGDPVDEADAAARMVDLVEWIQKTGKELNKGPFLVIAQNGERLIATKGSARFLASISGLGVESLWYDRKKRVAAADTAERLALLRRARTAGKSVVVTDYVDDGSGLAGANGTRIREFVGFCRQENFDYYVARANQALDRINRVDGIQP